MKYFPKPPPVNFLGRAITFDQYLHIQGAPHPDRAGFTVWNHPIWRASAENAEHFETAREAVAKAGKYVAMMDEPFAIFKPLCAREGEGLDPEFMPHAKCVLRATSTKPEDYDEPKADGQAAEVSAN